MRDMRHFNLHPVLPFLYFPVVTQCLGHVSGGIPSHPALTCESCSALSSLLCSWRCNLLHMSSYPCSPLAGTAVKFQNLTETAPLQQGRGLHTRRHKQ